MRSLALFVVAAALAAPGAVLAQWQWVDRDGRKVFSDQPPPPGTPQDKILRQPAGSRVVVPAEAAPAPAAIPPAPKVSGKDKELEGRKKAQEAAEAEKKKAEEEKVAQARAENCTRFRRAKAQLDSGVRISRAGANGEREFMDDKERASEGKRLEGLIERDCKAAQ